MTRRVVSGAVALLTAAVAAWGVSRPELAFATPATATISAGSLAFVASPATAGFSVTLNGLDQVATTSQSFDVADATGSGLGWNITATSTTFSTGGATPRTLPPAAVTIQSTPTVTCDTGATCTLATPSVSFPYSLPAGSTAPTATKVFNAAANTGLGNQTMLATMRLAVPANTFAGGYAATWFYSLVSGP